MKIRCDSGLCDRLRFIFSYLYTMNGAPLSVYWNINKLCNGHFLDIYNPIRNLEFTDEESNINICGWEPINRLGYSSRWVCEGPSTEVNIYQDLTLKPDVEDKIFDKINEMGIYVAMHIRRTDKETTLKRWYPTVKLTSDEEFIEFARQTYCNIFLATDCYHVQNKFKDIFGDRLFWYEKIGKPWTDQCPDFRPLSLKITAADIYTCIHAYDFKGTNRSGMSDFIYFNRSLVNRSIHMN